MRVLHVVATPRPLEQSTTLQVTQVLLEEMRSYRPDLDLEVLDLYEDELPAVAGMNIDSKYALMLGLRLGPGQQPAWEEIEHLIAQFKAADLVVVSAPMWNFHVPYALKYYIDAIVQPGYLFRYDENGVPHGLCSDRRLVFVTSRGGDYSAGGPMHAFDLQEPYLRAIFGFCGALDLSFVHVQPTDMGLELRAAAVERGIAEARRLAAELVGSAAIPRQAEAEGTLAAQ
jgi:FMN-dependent NADH-azoreductase